jgi:uncharacterized protein YcaQ
MANTGSLSLGISLDQARRIALAAHGFARPRPSRPANARDIASTIRRLGLVQIDYANVLIPAHYMVLFSRLGPYRRALFDDVVYRRRLFTEQWAHEASIVPVETWPLLKHRMAVHRVRPWGFEKTMAQYPGYVEWVLDQVRERGPLAAADLHSESMPKPEALSRRVGGTWFRSTQRAMLEAHLGRGVLAVAGRLPNFARVFDLSERVVAAEHHRREVEIEDAQRALLRIAASACGVATAADLADYFRMPIRDARARIAELVEAGELREVRVEGWREIAYLDPAAPSPRRIAAAAILSPFDPVVWFRPRAKRLFDFDYRIEIYVPPEKRKFGYYVLPFLFGDRIPARVDLKADRAGRRLLVMSAHLEAHADPDAVAPALATELRALAHWLELDSIRVARRGNLASKLARALAAVAN